MGHPFLEKWKRPLFGVFTVFDSKAFWDKVWSITFLLSSTMINSTNMILKRSGTTKTTVVCTIAVICNAVTWVILSDSDRFGSILVKVRRTSRSTRFRVTKQKRLSPRNLVFHMQPYETWSLKSHFSDKKKLTHYFSRGKKENKSSRTYGLTAKRKIRPQAKEVSLIIW